MKNLHCIRCGVMACLLTLLSSQSGFAQKTARDADAQETVIDLPSNVDEDRNRNIPVTFHLPNRQGAQPLVLVSHGGGGSRHGLYAPSIGKRTDPRRMRPSESRATPAS